MHTQMFDEIISEINADHLLKLSAKTVYHNELIITRDHWTDRSLKSLIAICNKHKTGFEIRSKYVIVISF